MSKRDYLTTAEAATKLSIGTDQVVSLIHCGAIRAVDVSTGKKPRWRIAAADLEAFISSRTYKPMPAQPRRRRHKPKVTVDYFPTL